MNLIEIVLGILLVFVVIKRPLVLKKIVITEVGRVVFALSVLYLVVNHGKNVGILSCLIFVVMINDDILEGLDMTNKKSYKKLKRSGDALFSSILWRFPPCFMRRIQKKYPRGTTRPAQGTPGRLSKFFKNVYIFTKGIPPGLSEIQTPRHPIFDQLSHETKHARALARAALCVV